MDNFEKFNLKYKNIKNKVVSAFSKAKPTDSQKTHQNGLQEANNNDFLIISNNNNNADTLVTKFNKFLENIDGKSTYEPTGQIEKTIFLNPNFYNSNQSHPLQNVTKNTRKYITENKLLQSTTPNRNLNNQISTFANEVNQFATNQLHIENPKPTTISQTNSHNSNQAIFNSNMNFSTNQKASEPFDNNLQSASKQNQMEKLCSVSPSFALQNVYANPNGNVQNLNQNCLQFTFYDQIDIDRVSIINIDKESGEKIAEYKLVKVFDVNDNNQKKQSTSVSNFQYDFNEKYEHKIMIKDTRSELNYSDYRILDNLPSEIVNYDFKYEKRIDLNKSTNVLNFDEFLDDSKVDENSKGLPEYNILLLGESGAGKSTTVNAFANYMKYRTFEEAKAGNFIELIPSKFTLPHPETNMPLVIKSSNWDDNERPNSGQDEDDDEEDGCSSTQSPLGYKFIDRNRLIRIIDTPGMGDTRGIEIDKRNFAQILRYLNHHRQLHGIVLLIKASETRKTASFRYCINELLSALNKSACQNIMFCFTFSRNSFYGPGDGFTTLREFLNKELSETNLVAKNKINCFFIDNEAYRFLVAQKHGYKFRKYLEQMYHESWDQSAAQTQSMINRITQLEPHNLRETTLLNYARKLIFGLVEPMIQLEKNIREYIQKNEKYKELLKNVKSARDKLQLKLKGDIEYLDLQNLDTPSLVCTKCADMVKVPKGEQIPIYKFICHDDCFLRPNSKWTKFKTYQPFKHCKAMHNELCLKCSCHFSEHKNITRKYVRVNETIVDDKVESKTKEFDSVVAKIQNALSHYTKIEQEHQLELWDIQDVAANLDYILTLYSNTLHRKFIDSYSEKMLPQEKNRAIIEILQNIKKNHNDRVQQIGLKFSNKTNNDLLNFESIPQLFKRLFMLKSSGQHFQQLMASLKQDKQNEFNFRELVGIDLSEK